jgi:hypothetical protein
MEQFFHAADYLLAHLTFLFLATMGAARLLIQEISAVRRHKLNRKTQRMRRSRGEVQHGSRRL